MGRVPLQHVPLTNEQKQLATENVGLVFHWALRLGKKYPGVNADDLTGIGFIALCRATQLFDQTVGKKFVSYASRAIINAMMRAISDNRWLVHVPTALSKLVWDWRQRKNYLPTQQELGLKDGRYMDFRSAWLIRDTEVRVGRG